MKCACSGCSGSRLASILSHSKTNISPQCGHGTKGISCEPSSKLRVILQPGSTSGVLIFKILANSIARVLLSA